MCVLNVFVVVIGHSAAGWGGWGGIGKMALIIEAALITRENTYTGN